MVINDKGVSMIIVIFAMMLFGVLGWTLAAMISTDFDANLRNLDFERSLYLADSGAQWALGQLQQSFDCTAINAATYPHSLNYGQYECVCDNSQGAIISIVSTGYIPSKVNYRSMRQVRVEAVQAGGVNAATGGERFDWDGTRAYTVTINGDIVSRNFEGPDANTVVNEAADTAIPATDTFARTITPYPAAIPPIDMDWFKIHANRLIDSAHAPLVISNNYNNEGIVYVEGDVIIHTGSKANQGANVQHTSIIADGNIIVDGIGSLSMMAHVNNANHIAYPNLATKNGSITTSAPSDYDISKRDFDGLLYTQTGSLDINCIKGISLMGKNITLRGNVFLTSKRADQYVNTISGFSTSEFSSVTWKEQ